MRNFQVNYFELSIFNQSKISSLGKGTILISSDPEERDEQMLSKPLSEFCQDGAMLR